MKYLVQQNTRTQEEFNQHLATINNKQQELVNVNNKISALENNKNEELTKVNNKISALETKQTTTQTKIELIEKSSPTYQLLENKVDNLQTQHNDMYEVFQVQQAKRNKKIEQIKTIFEANEKSCDDFVKTKPIDKASIPIYVEFTNVQQAKQACMSWGDCELSEWLDYIIDIEIPQHLKPHKDEIKLSKLFVSAKSVLNGEWIQIQGLEKLIDINTITLFQLCRDGDNTQSFKCIPDCTNKNCPSKGGTISLGPRHHIKFKWQKE
jgi:hypothetical protein